MTVDEVTQHTYNQLSSEYFSLVKPEPFPEEIDFYKNVLDKVAGPTLYAMCGAGRLLIPLLKAGYVIEGLDGSSAMLNLCRKDASNSGLKTVLYQQSIQNMSIDKAYECIFIIGGSFQLIYPREVAIRTLYAAKKHLVEGGKLYIDTFIPWELLHDSVLKETFRDERQYHDGTSITLETHTIANRLEQFFISQSQYSKVKEGRVLGTENEVMPVLWYYHFETILLLESVGFRNIKCYDNKIGLHPELTVYEAIH